MTDDDGAASDVEIARKDGVVTLRLNRPAARNAITEDGIEQLISELRAIDDSPGDRAVLLTGVGDAFCAGIDLAKALNRGMPQFMRRVGELALLLHQLSVPTVACVRGPAVGLGFSLALGCDLILAGSDAYFAMVFHQRGLALDGGASWLLPKRVGVGRAKEIAFLGERIPADRAYDLGIVNLIVEPADLDVTADRWMERLAAGPPLAQRMSKELLNAADSVGFGTALVAEANAQSVAFSGKEAREGMKAFLQKRAPTFPDS